MSKYYKNIIKLEKMEFTGIFAVYSALVRDLKFNISFINFIVYYNILNELKILTPKTVNGLYSFDINRNLKTNLNDSKIYNTINLIRRLYE